MPQYIEEKELDFLGYGMETILSLVAHLCTWPVITNSERMATKAAFIYHWRDSSYQHLSAYDQDLTRRQNNAKKYNVNITDNEKVTQVFACIYKADILKDSVM